MWYLLINNVPALDFMGALRAAGRPVGPSPVLVGGLALALVTAAFTVTSARHARR
ncbi:hypothetical protein Drose_15685 [Dactylosporangium roseum]|uniref:Uncharacterized protein n=1 Tax=Dactylosporangium roseum TaxID=47989 RepID=A0ABY5ZD08_9ACTN|nr:hypothetical protein [Dactylosporangium roseum]UWZ39544.1 hypothetical protein Drose_15685 [Dactylosporangium roseum]